MAEYVRVDCKWCGQPIRRSPSTQAWVHLDGGSVWCVFPRPKAEPMPAFSAGGNVRLDDTADQAAEDGNRVANEIANTLRLMRAAMGGQPGAQHFEQSRTTGHTTVTDELGWAMPAISDPTGEAAVRRALGKDTAANDHRQLSKLIRVWRRTVSDIMDIQARYQQRAANAIERASTARDNDPGCQSCARTESSPGIKRWEPVRCAIEVNGRRIEVCRWCQDFYGRKDRLPTPNELNDHHAGKRVA